MLSPVSCLPFNQGAELNVLSNADEIPTAGLKTPLISLLVGISDLLLPFNGSQCFSDTPGWRSPLGTDLPFDLPAFTEHGGDVQGRTMPLGNLPWCCTDSTRHFLSWHLPLSTAGFLQATAFCGMEYEPQRLSEPNLTRHFISAISFQFLIKPTFDRFGILSVF